MQELSMQQKEFCRPVLLTGNKSRAFMDAGLFREGVHKHKYISQYALNLFRKDYIQAYYRQLKEKIDNSDEKLEDKLADQEAKAAKKYDCVAFIRRVWSGEELEDGKPAPMAIRLKAAEDDAKIRGLMTNKTEVTGDIVIDVVFDNE